MHVWLSTAAARQENNKIETGMRAVRTVRYKYHILSQKRGKAVWYTVITSI